MCCLCAVCSAILEIGSLNLEMLSMASKDVTKCKYGLDRQLRVMIASSSRGCAANGFSLRRPARSTHVPRYDCVTRSFKFLRTERHFLWIKYNIYRCLVFECFAWLKSNSWNSLFAIDCILLYAVYHCSCVLGPRVHLLGHQVRHLVVSLVYLFLFAPFKMFVIHILL